MDFGTAITLDVVSKEGVYLGGAIAPGVETAAWGLHERASKLPKFSFEFPDKAIGKTTEQSMQAGVILGFVQMIDGLIKHFRSELGQHTEVVATGGLCNIFVPNSHYIQHVEPHLVLDGLIKVYLRNNK